MNQKQAITKLILAVIIILFLGSCASRKHPKKCNGKKGVQTRMGVM